MYVSHLQLHDFRSYADVDVALEPGVTAFIGRNGQGKTNLVEAIDYLSRLASHRVATDAPLVRAGAEQAVVRAAVVRDGRTATLEVEINPGRVQPGPGQPVAAPPRPRAARPGAHRGLLPRGPDPGQGRPVRPAPVPRRPAGPAHARGWPASAPTTTGCCGSATRCSRRPAPRAAARSSQESALSTLDVWDAHLARTGAELLAERLALVEALRPYVGKAYETVARGATRDDAEIEYRPSFDLGRRRPSAPALDRAARSPSSSAGATTSSTAGVSLVGPHRDELRAHARQRRRTGCR